MNPDHMSASAMRRGITYEVMHGRIRHQVPLTFDRIGVESVQVMSGVQVEFDRMLKSNTTKRRTHCLLRQGIMLFQLIPTMPEHRLLPLVDKFAEFLNAQTVFVEIFGVI